MDPARHPVSHPAEAWAELRDQHPVAWCELEQGKGFWVISRYADIAALHRDTVRLSSRRGNVVQTVLAGGDSAGGRMLVVTDPPRHTEVRRILQRAFTRQAMAQLSEILAGATRQAVADLVAKGGGDFATEVAAKVPAIAMCELFAVPEPARPRMLELTMAAMGTEATDASPPQAAAAAKRELLEYFSDLLTARREQPGTDLVSLMAAGRSGADSLTDAEILLNCYNIIVGGDETTRFSSSGAALAFTQFPGQWQRIREDEETIDAAVEEIFRWTTPATHVARTATSEIELHGVRILAGDVVTLWNRSANRDGTVFTDPYAFDVSRAANKHLALGHGPHFCLGAPLARLELGLLLRELRAQVVELWVDGPVEYIESSVLAGIRHLPVKVR
ncbi:cytochrome P450 [Kribbella sp. NPDC051718]|uniref:cytochrome P450 n=1 Tax=Kribbella sp. NPDC051718 TaxID=3155168 RepID=UPI0034176036